MRRSATTQRRWGGWLMRGGLALLATLGAALSVAVFPVAALAASPPSIVWTNAWNLTSTDASLGAEINPEGLPHGAYYQFQVVTNTSEYLAEIACSEEEIEPLEVDGCTGSRVPEALPIREVSGTGGKFVSLDLEKAGMTLKPGTTYHYRVLAVKAQESEDTLGWEPPAVLAPDHTFTTPIAPVINSVSLSHLTPTDATLEAQINTEGLPTTYEFQMWSSPCSKHGSGCELLIDIPLPAGSLLGSFAPQSVSLDLNSASVTLGEGEYGFSVLATSKAGSTTAGGGVFEAPPGPLGPPSLGVSPLPGAGQPPGSNSGDQPAGSTSSSSSSALGVQSPGLQLPKTTKLSSSTNAQKLSKALKACAKKPKDERAACKKQAHKQYGTPAKKSKKR